MKPALIFIAWTLLLCGCAQSRQSGSMGGANSSSTGTASGSGTSGQDSSQQATGIAARDKTFVKTAAELGQAEVQIAQVATQNGFTESVKMYAQHLVKDHTASNQQLASLASQKGISAPMQPDRAHQKIMDRMTGLQGAEFDREFKKQAIRDHELQIKLYQKAAEHCVDPDIKSFAQQNLPILQQHLAMAMDLPSAQSASALNVNTVR